MELNPDWSDHKCFLNKTLNKNEGDQEFEKQSTDTCI